MKMAGHVILQALRLPLPRTLLQPKSFNAGKCLPALLQHSQHHQFSPRCHQIPGQRRNFSVGEAAGYLLQGSELLITNVHTLTGTPWFLSIPLVALTTNLVFRTPITWYTHQTARKRARLVPLIQAQTALIAMGLRKKQVSQFTQRVREAMKKRTREAFRLFAINETRSIWGGLLTLPVFISNLEVLRRMCGGSRGLLGNLIFASTKSANEVDVTAAAAAMGDAATEAVSAGPPAGDAISNIPFDPSFATDGCLWFPNLLESDPYHILPFAVSAVMVAHMIPSSAAGIRDLFGMRPEGKGVIIQQSARRRAFQRTMLIMAFAIGPVTMDLPAALHLYWFSSAMCSLVVSKGLKVILPLPKQVIRPCRGLEIPLLMPKPPKKT